MSRRDGKVRCLSALIYNNILSDHFLTFVQICEAVQTPLHFIFFLPIRMRLKVRLIRGSNTFLRTGRLWYQKVLVGLFMRSRLPCASSSLTGSMCLWADLPRASLCRKIKSRATPRDTEAIGQRGSSSFSSSRCSPIWSWPSWYLVEKGEQHETQAVQINKTLDVWLTYWPKQS